MMINKRLVCITGMDGSGKSTLIQGVKEFLAPVYMVTIWDLLNDPVKGLPFKSKEEVDNFLCGLTSGSRLFFLAHAMKYAIDKALESEKTTILIDSYYYKYFASERVLGADDKLIKTLEPAFPQPDIVIELILPLNEVLNRKKLFSRYECGLSDNPGSESFIDFQKKVMKAWDIYDIHAWKKVNASGNAALVLQETLKYLI
jgi:dTMP kinase